jgi:anti-anti-sigma regulatory factor
MEINHKVENGILNVAIEGRLDAATAPVAEEEISGGLRVILSAAKEIRRRDGKVALAALKQVAGYFKRRQRDSAQRR